MSSTVQESKLVAEVLDLQVDFLSSLAPGETLISSSATVVVSSGIDPNPSAMLSGASTRLGTTVTQKLTGGLAGVVYLVNVSAGTSLSNIIVKQVYLAVLSDLPFKGP